MKRGDPRLVNKATYTRRRKATPTLRAPFIPVALKSLPDPVAMAEAVRSCAEVACRYVLHFSAVRLQTAPQMRYVLVRNCAAG